MTLVAVSDTGPIIHLDEICSLELLAVFDRLCIPEAVDEELDEGDVPAVLSDLVDEHVAVGRELQTDDLDRGERAALTVAKRRDCMLLTDDLAAREEATEHGVEAHGSIGVIVLGYSRGRFDRDEAASRMRTLQRETSLFVTDSVVERGIEMLDEE